MKTLITLVVLTFYFSSYAKESNTYHICSNKTGDLGIIKYKGLDHETAMLKTVDRCVELYKQQYKRLRNERPSVDRQVLFLENCLNNTYCRRK